MGFDEWLKSIGYTQVGNEDDGYRWMVGDDENRRYVGGRSPDNSTSELDELRARYFNTLTDPQGRPIYGTSGYNFEPESGNLPINGLSQVDPSQYTPEVINAAAQYGINLTPQYDPQYGYVIPQQSLAQWANIISPESWFDKYGPALIQGAAMGGVGLYNAALPAATGAGWVSGYDLPMGGDLLSMTGAGGIPAGVSVTAMAAPEVGGMSTAANSFTSPFGVGEAAGYPISLANPEYLAGVAPYTGFTPAQLAAAGGLAALGAGAASGAGSALGSAAVNAATNTATNAATKSAMDKILGGIESGNWSDVLSGLGQGAASIGPGLAAINYARNQDPFDTSRLESIYSQVPTSFNYDTSGLRGINVPNYSFDTSRLNAAYDSFDPMSVTKQYDLNTGQGRGALADSLSARGVAGSSFGNYDMANYGVQRDAGRQSLINDAIMKRAGIAESLLNNDRATAALNLQGLGLQRGIQNDILGIQQNQDRMKMAGLGMQGELSNQMLQANVKDREMRNNLYGRALLALSGGLSPSKLSLW